MSFMTQGDTFLALPKVETIVHAFEHQLVLIDNIPFLDVPLGDWKESFLVGSSHMAVLRSFLGVRIDNFSPLELQSQEQELNLEPGFPRAAGPEDCKTNCPHFSGIKPLQADVEEDNPSRKVDQAKEIIALSGMPITTTNGGNQATTISFMNLKSTPAIKSQPKEEAPACNLAP
ncbi:hypothetical protein DSO57_1032983 [Entomophthora muscae]|uniref:Uncharacterized protein n=1 Tax=Entomophthora muscae TaxID=34485 RepID=A0ACC2TZA7_9FUNG|nr:hypothetical protein DSO57_1032983 [Entomophthora muscae]